ncbi:MAG TPA: amino acid adenylation domain-containing protein, partial [Thermoanaerobaculia bacterium]
TWPGPVHARLDRWAREAPDRVAIAWAGGAVSYRRLAEAAGAVAARLAEAGIGRGDVVAIRARRSPTLVPAVLGTLRAGAAFLLLDPAYPAARNAACLARARPAAWLRLDPDGPEAEEIEAGLDALPGLRLRLDLAGPGAPAPDGAWTGPAEVGPSDVAYVAFTSGSTGEPKGVVGLHRSLSHFLPWQERAMALSADDRFSLLSGLAHDPLHRDLFTPLWLGGAVVVPDGERIGEPGWLAGWAARERVTVAHLTPALGRVLTDFAETGGDGGPPLPDLRRALFVGDVLSRRAVARLRELAPSVAPINLYGATESQRAVSWWPVPVEASAEDGEPEGDEALPLGHGMPGVHLLVLSPGGTRAGIGEVGEVFIASPHLAAGYLGDPRLTAERFLPHLIPPLTPRSPSLPQGGMGTPPPDAAQNVGGGRMYRTGDLGRYRGDGAVEALGRADRQVQVRGFRVEPAEIEAALERHPAVARAAVVPWDGRLVAYPVAAPPFTPEDLDPRELRRHLAALLPDHMVPAAFVPLPELPLTPNRKLDRARLPPPLQSPEPAAETGERAGGDDPMSVLVARIWGEVLEIEPPGLSTPGADFFDLGGHSLQVTRVLARVRDLLGIELPVRSLFEHSTAGAFARHLEALRWRAGEPGPPPLTAAEPPSPVEPGEPEEAPASFGQERLWLIDRLEGSRAYHLGRSVALRGVLDAAALARALGRLAERHGALRTGLHLPDSRERSTLALLQRVEPDVPLPLPRVDLQGLP